MKLALLFTMCCGASAAILLALPGTYNDGGVIKNCKAGTYSPAAGAKECLKCAEGSIAWVGASMCMTCPAGMFYVSESRCDRCPAGQYTAVESAKECLKCPAGHSSSMGSSRCSRCPKGHFSVSGGECTQCPQGHYAANEGSTTCTKCPAKTASAAVGATSKDTCVSCANQHRIRFTPAGSAVCLKPPN
jgi:hypothetical protein